MDLSFTAESKYFNNKAHYPIGLIDGNIEYIFFITTMLMKHRINGPVEKKDDA